MTVGVKQTINNILQSYRTGNCADRFIYQHLAARDFNITFCINGQQTGNAKYAPSLNMLTFTTDYAASRLDILQHEMFHAYQDDKYTNMNQMGTGQPGYVNIEFEQAVFYDIVHGSATAFSNGGTAQQISNYQNWLASLTNNFTQFPNITPGTTAYNTFKTEFFNQLQEYNSVPNNPYHSPILPSQEPTAMLTVLRSTTKNCQ